MPARLAMSVTDTEAKPRSTNSTVPATSTSSRREGRWAGRRAVVGSLMAGLPPVAGGTCMVGSDHIAALGGPMNAGPERRPAHRPSRVDEIVDAGIRVFARKGLAGATMAEVAEDCGMGPGALYYHFANKEQLFAQCVRSVADDVANITGRGGAPPGSLPEVVRLIYDWYAACPDKARLF